MIYLSVNNGNTREIIQSIFSPLVGIISSPLADDVCQRNNLTFVELLQPFAKLPSVAHFRDVSGTSVSVQGLRLNFCDVDWRPPQPILARKMLNEAVTNASNENVKSIKTDIGYVDVPTTELWFERWRETFLNVQFPSDHEFTRHLLSCLIVLSSSDPSIVETAQKLTKRIHETQLATPQKLPKWFHPSNVLNSYVVLHEGSQGDLSRAQQGFELLKSTFGDTKCFLIQINSLDESAQQHRVTDYWAPYIKCQHRPGDGTLEVSSAPKTPQENITVMTMSAMQNLSLMDAAAAANRESDPFVMHPLSPVQENAAEAINSKFSSSTESITSHTINPNIWSSETAESDSVPHGMYLNAMDVENLRHFVQDYAVRALIPYVEQLVSILSEAVTNKKGVSKSIFSATKRLFVISKPVAGASSQNAVIYTNESVELQTRKLADLYFMFCNYNLAFQAYHQAKRDFNGDSAWQYYAGALEMAALSAFLLGTANRKTYDYMDDAIKCYLNVCKMPQFATRATILSVECLKGARQYGEAAKQLTRMTSEDSDLRSALLLEQAAYCFLAIQPLAMHRKYAFHLILAGNRFSRAGQRRHAYRCYHQAFTIFRDRDWNLAEDHIQYTLAKQAYTLKRFDEARKSISCLLRPNSLQTPTQQAAFLKEFILTHNELIKRSASKNLLSYELPCIEQRSMRMLVSPPQSKSNILHTPAVSVNIEADLSDEHIWHKIEEMLVHTIIVNKAFVFKPTRFIFSSEHITNNPICAVQGEPIEIALHLANTLRCGLTLTGINLLWEITLENQETLSNVCLYEGNSDGSEFLNKTAIDAAIKCTKEQELILDDHEEKAINFSVIPKLTGHLNILGMVCQVAATTDAASTLLGTLKFQTKTKQVTAASILKVIPSIPYLSVEFSKTPKNLLAGEILPVTMCLRNMGLSHVANIYLGLECPRWITLNCGNSNTIPLSVLSTLNSELGKTKLSKDKEIHRQYVFRLHKEQQEISLKAQEAISLPLWIQAPYQSGECTLRLLFYYEIPESIAAGNNNIKYRLLRHTWQFYVHKGLRSDATCVVSNLANNDLSLNINVMNDMETNSPFKGELYINSIALYSPQYNLNASQCNVMSNVEITNEANKENCLQPNKGISYLCTLNSMASCISNEQQQQQQLHDTSNIMKLLKEFISQIQLQSTTTPSSMQLPSLAADEYMPKLDEPYSFLMKHETVFFKTNVSVEDFNNAVANVNDGGRRHATIILNWTANMSQNTTTRTAHGQHFMQLKELYELVTCPRSKQIYAAINNNSRIGLDGAVTTLLGKTSVDTNDCNRNISCDEYWDSNDFHVGKRCMLEDEYFVTVKA